MKDDMRRRQREVTSAMYFLVWHAGFSYNAADRLLCSYPRLVGVIAREGGFEARRCFHALSKLVEKLSNAA